MRAWPLLLATALCLAAPQGAYAAETDDGGDTSARGTRTVKAATGETLQLDYVLNEPWVGQPKRFGVRLTDKAGAPLANKLILMKVTGANPSKGYLDAFTTAEGTTAFSVTPLVPGTDLFTVCWDDEYIQESAPDCAGDTTANVTLTWTRPAFIAEPAAATEGDTGMVKMHFTVRLMGESGKTATVQFETKDGTAEAGVDYQATQGTLSFAAGEHARTVEVNVLPDTLDEPAETLSLHLFGAVNAAIVGDGTGQINDNDRMPTLSIDDVTVTEPDTGTADAATGAADRTDAAASDAVFTVSLSAPSARTVTVDYTTVPGTAKPGSDFASTNGTLTFAPGDVRATLPIPIVADAVAESDETFEVALSAPTNATLLDGVGEGTITEQAVEPPKRALPPDEKRELTPPTGDAPTAPTTGPALPNTPPAGRPGDRNGDPCGAVTEEPGC